MMHTAMMASWIPMKSQCCPLSSIIGPKDQVNSSLNVVKIQANAVSLRVRDLFSGSTILRRMKPMANTPVDYPNTKSARSNQLPLFMAGPKYNRVMTTMKIPNSSSTSSGIAYFTMMPRSMEAIPKNTR